MHASTRERITQAARTLFNERGYNAVSVADIAQEVGISKGNLTYHFKRKEDIVDALVDEPSGHDTRPTEPATDLAGLDAIFLDMQRTVTDNAFYFWHYAQFAQLSPKIRKSQLANSELMIGLLRGTLANLEAAGLMKPEPVPGAYDALAEQLLMAGVYWIPFCELRGIERTAFRDHAWSILGPSLA